MRSVLLTLIALVATAHAARAELMAVPENDWNKAIESARVANKPLLVSFQMIMM